LFQINNACVTVFRGDSIPRQCSLPLDPSISGKQSLPQGLAATHQPYRVRFAHDEICLTAVAEIGY
jgi:hypothetical protein